jgi:HD-GYP domain-containing protein (c-di-GMP phosphodiesterase class II)/DNA-binding CsgD family transcriptional regulator
MNTAASSDPPHQLRLVEVLAPLSLVTDLGMGAPDEQAMRACLLATRLARRMGLSDEDVAEVYYTTLLKHLGCTATVSEEASHLAGDQLAARPLMSVTDFLRASEMFTLLRTVGAERSPLRRARVIAGTIGGFRWGPPVQAAVCEVAERLADRIGLSPGVSQALGQTFERWDGKGDPHHLRGEAIALPARFAALASRAVALHDVAGADAAIEGVRASSGGWLDAEISAQFIEHAHEDLASIDAVDALAATIEAEPAPVRMVPRDQLDQTARAFADMVDLQSVYSLGHSTGVAELATRAAESVGLPMRDCVALRRAAWLHDLGRVGVPAGIWAKAGSLTTAERERVRLHAYYTERILARSPLLEAEAAIAGAHHERLDGSGYHRGTPGREQPLTARILAAADAYQAMTQARPYRTPFSPSEAASQLAAEARAGRFDTEAVEGVLAAAGNVVQIGAREWPADLSDREVGVLRLIAAGCSNREIADRLVISRRTAEHHVQHVYAKIGVSTRPGATLFALEHELISAP